MEAFMSATIINLIIVQTNNRWFGNQTAVVPISELPLKSGSAARIWRKPEGPPW
jgi:hypothetical protein